MSVLQLQLLAISAGASFELAVFPAQLSGFLGDFFELLLCVLNEHFSSHHNNDDDDDDDDDGDDCDGDRDLQS